MDNLSRNQLLDLPSCVYADSHYHQQLVQQQPDSSDISNFNQFQQHYLQDEIFDTTVSLSSTITSSNSFKGSGQKIKNRGNRGGNTAQERKNTLT
jgi:hypothetical protein